MTAASSLSIAQPSLQGPAAWAEYMEERTGMPCDFYTVTSATSDFLKSWLRGQQWINSRLLLSLPPFDPCKNIR